MTCWRRIPETFEAVHYIGTSERLEQVRAMLGPNFRVNPLPESRIQIARLDPQTPWAYEAGPGDWIVRTGDQDVDILTGADFRRWYITADDGPPVDNERHKWK